DVDTVLDPSDGTIIAATAGGDNSVRIFAYTLSSTGGRMSARHEELADSAKLMGRRQAHTSDVNSVAFLPDRQPDGSWLLASVSDDESVKLWKGHLPVAHTAAAVCPLLCGKSSSSIITSINHEYEDASLPHTANISPFDYDEESSSLTLRRWLLATLDRLLL
ncbi:cytosolic iron-sulfur protein assembly, partial [Perkinsus olseni]